MLAAMGYQKLVRHDFVDVMLNTVGLSVGLLGTINLHSIISFSFALTLALDFFFLKLVVLTAAAFGLKILTSLVGFFASNIGTFSLSTCRLSVIDHGIRVDFSTLLNLFFLFFGLIGTVLLSISIQISLGLVRWEFGRGRCFGVPVARILA